MQTNKKLVRPNWTIVFNHNIGDFIGTGWEFYLKEKDAETRYNELSAKEEYSATKRPYYHATDRHHLGAAHWELMQVVYKKENPTTV